VATFHLLNFGCRASQADGAALKQQLIQAGLEEVVCPEQGHFAVLNTCTVTATADAEVRQVIRRIHRHNPRCQIVVTGCYAQRAPDEISQLPGVAWVVGNSHKHTVADLLRLQRGQGEDTPQPGTTSADATRELTGTPPRLLEIQTCGRAANPETAEPPASESQAARGRSGAPVLVGEISNAFHFSPAFSDHQTRPTLKIQDGCNACCSFCVIPQVRGRSRSLAPEKVVEQVRELTRNGYQEIVLSGINLGSYGKDLNQPISFLGLLEQILTATAIARVRISSIEAMDINPEFIRLVAHEPRVAQHFHVPLQSGSDRILRLMNRRYRAKQYAERILAIHEQIPNCGIGADVMVGFPGETEQDHAVSLRFIESLPFSYLHIFPYSARPGTRAAAMPGQLNGRVIRERGQQIRAVMARKRQAFLEAQIGRTLSALTLDEEREGARVALSSNYLTLLLPGSEVPPNVLLTVRIVRSVRNLLYGYPE